MADSFSQKHSGRAMLADYNQGIGDSWVKAITEIVTNSHQNYHQYWKELGFDNKKEKPQILIVANPDKEIFTIIDEGTGIAGDMTELAKLVEEYSQFLEQSHTSKGRSSFGRGMSDVLFRKGVYKNQILAHKNGKCLAAIAEWQGDKMSRKPIFTQDKTLSDDAIKSMIPEHGTQILFNWNSKNNIEKRKFPSKKEMLDSLQKYYELKTVFNDPEIDVHLYYLDSKDPVPKKLTFVNFQKNADQIGKTLSEIPLPIDGKYDIRIISAKMFKTKNAILNQDEGEQRTGGLFIQGEHGQIYDLTLFGEEKNYRDASLRMIGEVILSEDAKRYMDDFYTEQGVTILKRTREGFDQKYSFYKELKKKLSPWIVGILESESQDSGTTQSEQFKEAIKRLNEIGKELLESKNLEIGDEGNEETDTPTPPKLPDTIAFSPESPGIEQAVSCKIFLKINCEKIKPGTKILYKIQGVDSAHFDVKWETDRVPLPNKENLAKIPIFIKCNEMNATAEIVAETVKKNGEKTGEKYCFLKCVEEKDPPEDPLKEYLQFVPNHTEVETNIDKQVILWAHQILEPGTKVSVEFTCETHDYEPPITFENDGRQKIEHGTHKFEVEVPDTPLEPNAYRKIPIIFTGTDEGLRGKITADVDDERIIPTICQIEIKSNSEPEGGGLLSGWEVTTSPYPKYAWYQPKNTKVLINVGVPFVRKVLGQNQLEAEARCAKLQESQVFVAQTILDIFFDELVSKMYETRKLVFDLQDPDYRETHEAMVYEKQKLMNEYGNEILEIFAPNIRTKAQGGKVKQFNFKKENLEFSLWDLDMQENAIPPISFNELQEFRGNPANLSVVHFEIKGQVFEVGVYAFEGDKFVCCLHDYDKDGKYKVVMQEIERFKQIFKPAKNIPKEITLDEPVYSLVKISKWIGQANKRISMSPISFDQFTMIPDKLELNHSNILLESSSNWLSKEGEPLIQYAKHISILKNKKNDQLKDNLVCFVSKMNTRQMAKMFVRTKIIPAFADYNKLVKHFVNVTIQCENSNCTESATGTDEILTRFGSEMINGMPHPKKNCKHCS